MSPLFLRRVVLPCYDFCHWAQQERKLVLCNQGTNVNDNNCHTKTWVMRENHRQQTWKERWGHGELTSVWRNSFLIFKSYFKHTWRVVNWPSALIFHTLSVSSNDETCLLFFLATSSFSFYLKHLILSCFVITLKKCFEITLKSIIRNILASKFLACFKFLEWW